MRFLVKLYSQRELARIMKLLCIIALSSKILTNTSVLGGFFNQNLPDVGTRISISPNGTMVLFSSPRTGNGDIYTMRLDGTNWKQLTDTPAYDGEPVFSPDGSKIAFVSARDGNQEIYLMEADGRNPVRLTNSGRFENASPSFSPDGSRIVFVRRMHSDPVFWNKNEIFTIKIDGSDLRRLTSNDVSEWSPSFSPDGKSIIFGRINNKTSKFEIWVMSFDGAEEKLLLENASNPVFSPDGKSIAFVSDRLIPYEYEIYITDSLTGGNISQVTKLKQYISSVCFSPDGSKIIFFLEPSGNGLGFISSVRVDGTDVRTISKNY